MRLQPRARALPGAHCTPPCVATDVCTRVRTLYALLMRARRIKSFCEGAKTLLFKGERESRPLGLRRTAHVGRDAAPAASPRATTNAPAQLPGAQRTCNLAVRRQSMPATPASGLCPKRRNSTKNKSLRQNSRPARTNPIKSRPAACTSGGINNFPLKRKGRPMGGLFV